MPEYIDRNRLIEQLEEENDFYGIDSEYEWGQESQYKYDVKTIKEQPAADVVEVVRCKDCAFSREFRIWEKESGYEGLLKCECNTFSNNRKVVFDKHYCSFGERKEGAE